ncbi:MAG TPA: DUF5335 family protein [Pyrinomonadaceae bacterium]
MGNEIRQNEWRDFLKDFSKRHKRWNAKIEVRTQETGDHILIEGLPLNGISIEDRGKDFLLAISVGKGRTSHQTHTIKNPTHVAFIPDHEKLQEGLRIEEADGTTTLIDLMETYPLSTGYFVDYENAMHSPRHAEFNGPEKKVL